MPIKKNKIKALESKVNRLSKLERKGYTCSDAGFDLRTIRTSDAGRLKVGKLKVQRKEGKNETDF